MRFAGLECHKINSGQGFTTDPLGEPTGSLQRSPDPVGGFMEGTSEQGWE